MGRLCRVVKRFYDTDRYTKDDVKKFVKAGRLTEDEYKAITGDTYTNSESEG